MKNKIKTFEDACAALKIEYKEPEGLSSDEIAYIKLKIVAKALNKGWEPDWNNWDQYKYYPWFRMGDKGASPGVGFSFCGYDFADPGSGIGSRLCFKTRELAEYAGTQFGGLYKEYLLIN